MYPDGEGKRPEVLGWTSVAWAVALHAVLFSAFYFFAKVNFHKDEVVIPIDLTVVVNENLDGEKDEPPPLEKTKPPEPKPQVKPKPRPADPPPRVDDKVEAVEKVPEKKKPEKKKEPEKKEPEKKVEDPKPEPPKKTAKELREERLKKMRESAKVVDKKVKIEVKDQPSGNGRTERQTRSPAEIQRLLNQGYKPGTKTQIAESEKQRCVSLIKMALERKWEQMSPEVGKSGTVNLSFRFDGAGRMIDCRLVRSCGDAISDRAALRVAQSVGYVPGLSPDFIAQHRSEPAEINYHVRGL